MQVYQVEAQGWMLRVWKNISSLSNSSSRQLDSCFFTDQRPTKLKHFMTACQHPMDELGAIQQKLSEISPQYWETKSVSTSLSSIMQNWRNVWERLGGTGVNKDMLHAKGNAFQAFSQPYTDPIKCRSLTFPTSIHHVKFIIGQACRHQAWHLPAKSSLKAHCT